MAKFINGGTVELANSPSIKCYAAAVGKKEGDGPLAAHFDYIGEDITFGSATGWEQSECLLQQKAFGLALQKGKLSHSDISLLFGGDLLNQCVASGYAARDYDIPYIGLYGACSTMAEGLALASVLVDCGVGENVAAVTSSHYCSAERQFRLPLNYGGQRTPTSQWTATGAGCAVVAQRVPSSHPPYVKAVTFGAVKDCGIKDAANMGAAMAGAAYSTISTHLANMRKSIDDFDFIVTGDLGLVGSELLYELFDKDKINIKKKHKDCGLMLYDLEKQDVHAGGSGCGCAASVLCGYLLREIAQGKLSNILFAATGALMSPTLIAQGESIPGISHAVHIGG